MRVSLCMQVRNEEQTLWGALASVQGLVDEMVIVDNASTDRTAKIAAEAGALVLYSENRLHNAQNRNLGLDAATGDWVVILDADERVQDAAAVRAFLENTPAEAVYIRMCLMHGEAVSLSWAQMRMWRRGSVRYRYRAHELPVAVDGRQLATERTDLVWEHRPPLERGVWKRDRTLRMLLLDVDENPDDPRPKFYLGRQYVYRGEWDDAERWLTRYLAMAPRAHDAVDAWAHLAQVRAAQKDRWGQLSALWSGLALAPHRRDLYGELAELYHAQGQQEVAAGLLRAALEIPADKYGYVFGKWHGPHIWDLLARCYWQAGRPKDGLEPAREAVRLAPGDGRLARNLRFFEDAVR